ncbi:M43 family zinc metalloprotease [Aquimarina celericrescens]|uniref:M43 family zinc metalloprotease n=1 Tax=Aquimarina celericrescens TaxID=1964542 RepID=A0ABW5AZ56_9FLAO|nr:T9SS type A sorting domain-containing protein [Aquimarina celericrescens]
MKKYIQWMILFIAVCFSGDVLYSQTPTKKCATDEFYESLLENNALRNRVEAKIQQFNIAKNTVNTNNNQIVTIPVVFNIVHNGEAIGVGRNLSDARILEQLNILNQVYSNYNGQGVDIKIRFCLAKQDINGNNKSGILRYRGTRSEFYIGRDYGGDSQLKQNRDLNFPPTHYLNVWTADLYEQVFDDYGNSTLEDTMLGYATFPFLNQENNFTVDGIGLDYQYVGITSDNAYGGGMTLPHEVGHWLGLWHTFQVQRGDSFQCSESSCATQGDEVCDTEPRAEPAIALRNNQDQPLLTPNSCSEAPKCSNPNQNTNAVQNYMDYNYDDCLKFFTQGQKDRMRQMLVLYRPNMLNYSTEIVECSQGTIPNPPNNSCTPDSGLGFKINYPGGNFGQNVAIHNNLIAAVDPGRGLVRMYRINSDCGVVDSGILGKYSLAEYISYQGDEPLQFGEGVKVVNDKVFVVGSIYNRRFIAVLKENDSGWYFDQIIEDTDHNFAKSIIVRGNELLAIGGKRIMVYKVSSGGSYNLFQDIIAGLPDSFPGPSFVSDNLYQGSISYNGKYLISRFTRSVTSEIAIFKKNSAGRFDSDMKSSIDIRYTSVFIDNNDNIYASINRSNTGYSEIRKYRFSGSSLNLVTARTLTTTSSFSLHHDQVMDIDIKDNILILARKKAGISFHDTNNGLVEIHSPQLANNYPKYWLNPYQATSSFELENSLLDYGQSIAIDGNYLVAPNTSCGEVFIYEFDDIMNGAISDIPPTPGIPENINVCSIPSSNITKANNITIGDGCDVTFGSGVEKEFKAGTKIVIKPGTEFLSGSKIRLTTDTVSTVPTDPGNNCDLYDVGAVNRTATVSRSVSSRQADSSDDAKIFEDNRLENALKYSIVPVPVTNMLSVNSSLDSKFSIEIFDFYGNLILKTTDIVSGTKIEFSNQKGGIYLVRIVDNNGKIEFLKFVKN